MGADMRQLRRWHRKLSAAHTHACQVAEEAEAALGYDAAVTIIDPIVELHAALHVVEAMIHERAERRRHDPR